jgi:transposase-like protein
MNNATDQGLISYSESFKRQVVSELEQGKYKTPSEASRSFGIKGTRTVRNWCLKYGHKDLLAKRIRIESMKELDEKKQLRKRIKELEKGLSDMTLNYLLEKNFLELACKRLGEDVDSVKKKTACKP